MLGRKRFRSRSISFGVMDKITAEKRREDMMKLWKDTFHDSDRYVRLVFDNYYTLDNSFVTYHENRIIAAILCIGYEFQILAKEGAREKIKGMYLCGLATHPDWRRKGIMSRLMDEAEKAARKRGYNMTFLIPADDYLRLYYERKGYQTVSWRQKKEVESLSTSSGEACRSMNIYSVSDFFRRGQNEFLRELADLCRKIEHSRQCDTILHSEKDFIAIMAENENSIFFTDCSFDPEYPILAKVKGVAFPELSEDPSEPLRLVGLYSQTQLHEQAEKHNEEGISSSYEREEAFASEIRELILERFHRTHLELLLAFSSSKSESGRVEPYAMIKILDENGNLKLKNENFRLDISLMLD